MTRRVFALCLFLAGCGLTGEHHRFTDVVDTKANPGGGLVAALVWDEHGVGGPHTSGIVIVAKDSDPRDGDPVLLASEDFRPLAFRWTAADALEVRLPCGAWSSLTNRWQQPGTRRAVTVAFVPPSGCLAAPGTTALPAGASQPAGIQVSPN